MGTEPVQTVYVGAGGWDRGLGRGRWDGLVVLVLGAVFEDAGELHVVEVAFLINGCLSVHLVHLLICEAVAHGGEQLPKVVLMDESGGRTRGGRRRARALRHTSHPLPGAPTRTRRPGGWGAAERHSPGVCSVRGHQAQ